MKTASTPQRVANRLRAPHKLAADLAVWVAATPVAFLLRFDGAVPQGFRTALWTYLVVGAAIKLGALLVLRTNLRNWRKTTFRDTVLLALAVGSVMVIEGAIVWSLRPSLVVPASVPLLEAATAFLGLVGMRALLRWWDERGRRGRAGSTPVLVLGAGEAGTLLTREMLRHPEMGLVPVGFVDDDPNKLGTRIGGVEVLGTRDDLTEVLTENPVEQVLIAIPSAEGRFIRDTVERIREASVRAERGVTTRVMPGMYELLAGDVSVSRLREVRLEDLLRRPLVELDMESISTYLEGRRVLVTGAGGSIGSEIVRQLLRFRPTEVLLLGQGENSVYELDRELARGRPEVAVKSLIATVRDAEGMRVLFERHRPQVVFHAAAHKHVPLMEAHPEEAVRNNVAATRILARLALEYGVERFVNVSTDKAVNPASVMGSSKRLAECLVKDAAERARSGQRFTSVRFGNVLGSRGSVVPLFREQIAAGGPVTITDRRMTRYFMTIPEAAQLVLQTGALADNGAVYILDMGEPVRIVDLAEDLIRLSGLTPYEDVEIVEVGARPGEKLSEDLIEVLSGRGDPVHEKIFVTKAPGLVGAELHDLVDALEAAARDGRGEDIRRMLQHQPVA